MGSRANLLLVHTDGYELYVDIPNARLAFWTTSETLPIEQFTAQWPNWTIDVLYDRFETHLTLARGQLCWPAVSTEALLEELKMILHRYARIREADSNEPHDFHEIVDRAMNAWQQNQSP